jgi:hypothetical protein
MSDTKPWYPNLDKSKEFQDHPNPALGEDRPIDVTDLDEDSSPLEGSEDPSDVDSLEDVIASTFDPDTQEPVKAKTAIPKP